MSDLVEKTHVCDFCNFIFIEQDQWSLRLSYMNHLIRDHKMLTESKYYQHLLTRYKINDKVKN